MGKFLCLYLNCCSCFFQCCHLGLMHIRNGCRVELALNHLLGKKFIVHCAQHTDGESFRFHFKGLQWSSLVHFRWAACEEASIMRSYFKAGALSCTLATRGALQTLAQIQWGRFFFFLLFRSAWHIYHIAACTFIYKSWITVFLAVSCCSDQRESLACFSTQLPLLPVGIFLCF